MPQAKPPNVLLFFTDDQRFDTIRALGNSAISTPNIDRLVARGTTFTHAHIPCGTHGAICMPSRAMLHTGRSLFHLHDSGSSIPDEHTMLGEALRSQGYRTWGAGKWHNGRASFNRGFAEGDEIMFGGMADHWNVPVYHYDPSGAYDTRLAYIPNPPAFGNNEIHWRECDHIHSGRHSSEILCDAAVDYIGRQDGDVPFFAYVSLLAPHDPRTMPERFRTMYSPEEVELPPNFLGRASLRQRLLAHPRRTAGRVSPHARGDPAPHRRVLRDDQPPGPRVRPRARRTRRAGLTDNTLIVLAGDNGLAVGQHGLMGKQNCYEHSVRVPLIFAGPGVPEGRRRDAYVYLFDIFATLCELTGTPRPSTVEGESLVAAMNDSNENEFATRSTSPTSRRNGRSRTEPTS